MNSLLSTLDLGTYLDGLLFTSDTLCVIRYIPQESRPDENQPRHEDEEKRSRPSREGEGLIVERYYRPDDSGTTAHDQPAPEGNAPASAASQPRPDGTTADTQARYYRPSDTTAHPQAVLPLTPEATQEAPERSFGKVRESAALPLRSGTAV